MKLNTKKTVFVGFAFFLICLFWQAYDNIIPKILTDKFGMAQGWSGFVMALDNILALFLLPMFGSLSDKHEGKRGKRTPFIVIGTVLSVIFLLLLSVTDAAQLKKLDKVSSIDDPTALSELYASPAAEAYTFEDGKTIREIMPEETFFSIRSDAEDDSYYKYVVPLRQAYAKEVTKAEPAVLILFILILLLLLVSMGTFRSPAVALMPDVTVKPLRSKANAIINLMGSFGAILVLVLGIVFGTGKTENSMMSYVPFFALVGGLMILFLILFLVNVNEPKLVKEMHEDSMKFGLEDGEEEKTAENAKLSKAELRSLLLLLASVVLWFFGYNAVTSKYSVYAGAVLGLDYNLTLIIAQAAAIVCYIPIGMLSSKFGRKKMILCGIVLMIASFGAASFMRAGSPLLVMNLIFALAGIGWATINVNSYPMVVEMAKGGDIGKYTGFYYTASMAAQIATPVISGFLMDRFGLEILFPYSVVFEVLAIFTMAFVMHGDSRPQPKKSALEHFDTGD